jgi:hypothetical protein
MWSQVELVSGPKSLLCHVAAELEALILVQYVATSHRSDLFRLPVCQSRHVCVRYENRKVLAVRAEIMQLFRSSRLIKLASEILILRGRRLNSVGAAHGRRRVW